MLAKVGHKVRDVTRIKFGPLEIGALKPGQSRSLSPRELKSLRAATAKVSAEPSRERERPTQRRAEK
jgi:16S rRNA U516 pseudouridylate synthase RsuA-like enzyme